MKNNFWSLMIVFAISCILAGCDLDSNRERVSSTGSSETKMTNTDLRNAVKAKLDSDAQLKAADIEVDANAERNEVTLSGKLRSQALRARAVDLTRSVNSKLVVNDKIDVEPVEVSRSEYTEEQARQQRARAQERGETIGKTLDDAWIHAKVVTKLVTNPDTPQRKINVDVQNGVVTLRGNVSTPTEKSEAEQLAKNTDGVKQVVNRLRVGA
jgi:hyperosmotically inducible periplasmic protein